MTRPMVQKCHVYGRRARVFVQLDHRIYGGPVYVGGEEVVESDPLPSDVGVKVRNALAQSRDITHPPEDLKSLQGPLLRLAGVSSWSSFVRGTKCMMIRLSGEDVKITFMHPKGISFVSDNSDDVVLAPDELLIGRTVLNFLESA